MSQLSSPDPHSQDSADNAANKSQHSSAPSPQQNELFQRHNENSQERQGHAPWWHRLDWSQVVLDTLLLVVGIIVAGIYSKQLTQMVESNRINREVLYSVQRAFITVSFKPETSTYVINGKSKRVLELTTKWENVGNTPAVGIATGVGAIEQADEISEEDFLFKGRFITAGKITPQGALGPKSTLDSGTIREPEEFAFDNPTTPRFLWGWVVYRDIFPNSKPHVTEYCWRIMESKKRLDGPEAGKWHMSGDFCARHNCVDEFCEDYASIINRPTAN